MDFTNLDSKETLQQALSWLAEYIQGAILAKEKTVLFTFNPNEETSIDSLFDFNVRLKNELTKYGFRAWCILDNKYNKVIMKVFI